jgi:hypothetical protein
VKIISGGQTGVDRAALDAALKHGINCGGWCPAGRLDEFGKIPDRYPVKELPEGGFDERTRANVRDSDATVAIYFGELRGGTMLAMKTVLEGKKPHIGIDASNSAPEEAAQRIADLVKVCEIKILNVAGPRRSEWPEGYDYAFRALNLALEKL